MRVLIIAFWVLELVALAVYVRFSWPERTRKGFYLKLLCSTVFLAYGITLAVLIRYGINVSFAGSNTGELSAGANTFLEFTGGGLTDRAVQLIIAALAYGWLGDLFLGYAHRAGTPADPDLKDDATLLEQLADKKTAANTLGILAFILGNGLYCVAFGRAIYGYEFAIHGWSVIFFALPILVFALLAVKLDFGKHIVPVGIYFVALAAMLGLAMTLGIQLWPLHRLFGLCLMVGSGLFTVANIGLALESYGGDRFHKLGLRVGRESAYFFGQMSLATTILYFYTV